MINDQTRIGIVLGYPHWQTLRSTEFRSALLESNPVKRGPTVFVTDLLSSLTDFSSHRENAYGLQSLIQLQLCLAAPYVNPLTPNDL
jgi:hypothetical protein